MQLPDYYAILGVKPTATTTDIKQAYRQLARLHHPDINQQQQGTRIKQINEAYTILSDPQKRTDYNALLLEEYQRFISQPSQPLATHQEHTMTWAEGFKGFVEELKKGMKEE